MGSNIHQMDVKKWFLNGNIYEEVYIDKHQGFEINQRETHVYRLKKYLYGLNQARRAWYARMDTYLLRVHFTNIFVDPNLYIRLVHGEFIIIILYVDELLVTVVQHQI